MGKSGYALRNAISGKDLKEIRKRMGYTQAEFAVFLGCSKPTVERWESSVKPVTGPAALLVDILLRKPDLLTLYSVPEKDMQLRMWYMYKDIKCTLIDIDERRKKVRVKNYVEDVMFTAFGAIEKPTFEDYEEFLESRCFPRTRDKMKLVLEDLGIPFYDPYMIVKKTEGRMAEDDFWLLIE